MFLFWSIFEQSLWAHKSVIHATLNICLSPDFQNLSHSPNFLKNFLCSFGRIIFKLYQQVKNIWNKKIRRLCCDQKEFGISVLRQVWQWASRKQEGRTRTQWFRFLLLILHLSYIPQKNLTSPGFKHPCKNLLQRVGEKLGDVRTKGSELTHSLLWFSLASDH